MIRVAVTGLGVVSAIGNTSAAFWESLREGRHGFGPMSGFPLHDVRFANGAQVKGFDPLAHLDAKAADLLDRFSWYAVVAAREAAGQAGIAWTDELRERAGIFTGTCVGGQESEDREFWAVYREQKPRVHPMTIPRIMANAGASAISQELGLQGPVMTVSTACSSSNHALGMAFQQVRAGLVPVALAGGSESMFSYGILKAWEAMRVVAPDVCRPFSRDRRGLILGEGAAMLVLEPMDGAMARGAEILGEVVGFGMSADAGHITQPDPKGAALAMRRCLEDARVNAEEVGYVNAHGTGTSVNDPSECKALREVFGERALPVSSTKSMHGHALGAAGAMEAAAAILALREGVLPPTANFTEADPDCPVDAIPNEAREARPEYAISNSFAFGGLNASVAVRAFRRG